jgi:hypothetical protein
VSVFFAFNALSFVASALLLGGVHVVGRHRRAADEPPRLREGFAALRPRPALAVAIATLGVGVTISSGTWIVGVPQLVRESLHRGAASFSLPASAYAVGSVIVGVFLTRVHVRRKEHASFASWFAYRHRSSSRSSSRREGANPSILSIAPAAAAAAAAGIRPTSSDPATSVPRAVASFSTRARMSWSAAAS